MLQTPISPNVVGFGTVLGAQAACFVQSSLLYLVIPGGRSALLPAIEGHHFGVGLLLLTYAAWSTVPRLPLVTLSFLWVVAWLSPDLAGPLRCVPGIEILLPAGPCSTRSEVGAQPWIFARSLGVGLIYDCGLLLLVLAITRLHGVR
ncbi:MAG: hypothetical protein L0170_00070 [Acidobacteria bacterium]|nr:hypothetical protein [Acidobacteriota bacterium]